MYFISLLLLICDKVFDTEFVSTYFFSTLCKKDRYPSNLLRDDKLYILQWLKMTTNAFNSDIEVYIIMGHPKSVELYNSKTNKILWT